MQRHITYTYFNFTDPPMNAPMFNVTNITNESFIVRWDAVNDLFPVTYFIRWYGADGNNEQAYVNTAQSYTATGLNNNTSYNVTVAASNTCCGEGPVSKVIVVMTNGLPSPTTTTTNTTVTPSVTTNPTPGKYCNYIYVYVLTCMHMLVLFCIFMQ